MTFTKIYNASYSMLTPEQVDLFNRALEVRTFYKYERRITDGYLISCIIHYYKFREWIKQPIDQQFFIECLDAFCVRGMTTLDNIVDMLEGKKSLKHEMNGDNGPTNKGTGRYVRGQEGREERALAGMQVRSSSHAIPVSFSAFIATADEKYPKPKALNTIPKNWVDQTAVIEWCERKNIAWEYWDQYFDCRGAIQGRDGVYYELKQEYRDATR